MDFLIGTCLIQVIGRSIGNGLNLSNLENENNFCWEIIDVGRPYLPTYPLKLERHKKV